MSDKHKLNAINIVFGIIRIILYAIIGIMTVFVCGQLGEILWTIVVNGLFGSSVQWLAGKTADSLGWHMFGGVLILAFIFVIVQLIDAASRLKVLYLFHVKESRIKEE